MTTTTRQVVQQHILAHIASGGDLPGLAQGWVDKLAVELAERLADIAKSDPHRIGQMAREIVISAIAYAVCDDAKAAALLEEYRQ